MALGDLPAGETLLEFVNINRTVQQNMVGCFNANNDRIRSPWLPNRPGTLTGSTKWVMRVTTSLGDGRAESSVRALDAIEYFALIGRDHSEWKSVRSMVENSLDAHRLTELAAKMAGNAFNAWQYGAVQIAQLATWGHFLGIQEAETKTEEPINDKAVVDKAVVDSSSDECLFD